MSGTADGWKRGRGPSAFFRDAPSPPERPEPGLPAPSDARSCEPSSRTTRGGERAGLRALRNSARSRIGCSWGLGTVRFTGINARRGRLLENFRFIEHLAARRASPEAWRAHHARHRVPHVGRGGAHETSLGISGTADGWKRGRGPSAFFRDAPSSPERPGPGLPASPDARSCEPSPRTTRGGERAGLRALRNSARSRIGCSWGLGPVRFRQASPPAVDGDAHEGFPQKISHGPLPHLTPVPTLDFACTGHPAARRPHGIGGRSLDSAATRSRNRSHT